jgi:hypothetical protein
MSVGLAEVETNDIRTHLLLRIAPTKGERPSVVITEQSGGAGESHPHAPTDPNVTVSRHSALITQPLN